MPVKLLYFFRLGQRSTQTHRKITGEVVSSDRDRCGMRHGTVFENDQIAGTRAQVGETNPQFAFISAQHSIRSGKRFKYRVIHVDASAVHCRNHVLNSAG